MSQGFREKRLCWVTQCYGLGVTCTPKTLVVKVGWVWESEWTTGLQPSQWIPKFIEYVSEEVGPGWRMLVPGDVPLMQISLKGIFLTQLLRLLTFRCWEL